MWNNKKLVKEFIRLNTGVTDGYSLPLLELLAINYHMVQLFIARTIPSYF